MVRGRHIIFACALLAAAADPPEYTEAVRLVQQQRWKEALSRIDRLRAEYPRNAKVLNLAGLALLGSGDVAAARTAFEQALHDSPGFAPALKNLAILEWNNHMPGPGAGHTEAALKLNPRDPVLNAYAALERKDPKSVEESFARAGAAISSLPAPLETRLGVKLGETGMYPQAVSVFSDLIANGHDTPAIRYNLGLAQFLGGKYEDAASTLKTLRSSDGLNLLAHAYEKAHQTQKAIDTLREAISAGPADENNYLDLSNICIDNGLYPAGIEVVEAGIVRQPRSARLQFQLGLLRALSGNFEPADAAFERAAALNPASELPAAAMQLANIQQSRLGGAIQQLRQDLRKNPESGVLWYLLGSALTRRGAADGSPEQEEAAAAFQKAMKLAPQLPYPWIEMGKIHMRRHRADEAIPLFENAAKLAPESRAAYYQLAIGYRQLGKPERAAEMLAKVKELGRRDLARSMFQQE